MKSILQRIMLSSAFVVGLAIPFASTWTNTAQALEECSFVSGRDSWAHSIPGSGSFTVSMHYVNGVTLTGTPPPLSSLPLVLTSASGNVLTITTVPGTPMRQYSGTFTAETPETCSDSCWNLSCDNNGDCTDPLNGMKCLISGICTSVTCDGVGGSCSGGVCAASHSFTARF